MTPPVQQYTCRSCKNAECPVWIGSNLQEAQSGRLRDTHPILAVIMTVGCTYHSAFRPHPAPAAAGNRKLIEEIIKKFHELENDAAFEEYLKALCEQGGERR
jgi:hypothetical protein